MGLEPEPHADRCAGIHEGGGAAHRRRQSVQSLPLLVLRAGEGRGSGHQQTPRSLGHVELTPLSQHSIRGPPVSEASPTFLLSLHTMKILPRRFTTRQASHSRFTEARTRMACARPGSRRTALPRAGSKYQYNYRNVPVSHPVPRTLCVRCSRSPHSPASAGGALNHRAWQAGLRRSDQWHVTQHP